MCIVQTLDKGERKTRSESKTGGGGRERTKEEDGTGGEKVGGSRKERRSERSGGYVQGVRVIRHRREAREQPSALRVATGLSGEREHL